MKNKNNILFYLQMATYNCASIIAIGSVFQAFMLESGIDESSVSFCVSTFQIIQTLTTLLLSKWAENIKNVLRAVAVCLWSFIIILSPMLLICIEQNIPVKAKFIILFASGGVFYLIFGIHNILSYKQPHHIMDIKDYGRVSGQSGVYLGILGAVVSAAITLALGRYEYFSTMTVVIIIGIVLSLISGLIGFAYKPIEAKNIIKNTEKINIFRYKPFYQLLIPNFLRGVSTGVINLVAVIGYYCKILDSSTAAVLVTLSQIATLIGCQSYASFAKRNKNGILCLASGVALCITMPLMTAGNTKTLFALFYFITFFFNNYISYAVPVIVAEHIDYNCLGQYTAWRMGLFTLGVSVGGAIVPFLLEAVGATTTLLIGGLAMLPCGIGYYIFEKRQRFYMK